MKRLHYKSSDRKGIIVKRIVQLCAVISVCFLGAGCATNRGMIDVRVPAVVNPVSGPAVKITKVNDLRRFELHPSVASIPSLKDGQIENKTITSRAIARKRNGFGQAMGDILLPEGRSVEELVRESVAKALKERGYIVIEKDSPLYASALPIEINIHQFWAWMNPGFWTLGLEFEGIISADNTTVFTNCGQKIRGHIDTKTQAAGTGAWKRVINLGIEDLGQEIKRNIKSP